jgi:hypothetical protein
MLTQLETVKLRLAVSFTDDDVILQRAIAAVSARFEAYCNRSFGRVENARQEFPSDALEFSVESFPIESVAGFAIKRSEAEGWIAVSPAPEYFTRGACVIALLGRLGAGREMACAVYSGGYVLPGTEVAAGQAPLPADIEQACVEQVAFWYQNRSKLGVTSVTENSVTSSVTQEAMLPSVEDALQRHIRLTI